MSARRLRLVKPEETGVAPVLDDETMGLLGSIAGKVRSADEAYAAGVRDTLAAAARPGLSAAFELGRTFQRHTCEFEHAHGGVA